MIPLRDENPSESLPFVTYALILANAGVFALQAMVHLTYGPEASQILVFQAGAIPLEIAHLRDVVGPPDLVPVPFTLLTSMFLHGGIAHLLGNMLFLWIFGDNVEDFMGHLRFLVFYIGTGLVAAIAHVATNPSSTVPVVGASGAISGVLGAYILLYPHAKVLTLIPLFPFYQVVRWPAWVFLGVWFAMQLLSATIERGGMPGSGVAFMAHIGGFVAGLAVVPLFERRRRRRRVDTYWE